MDSSVSSIKQTLDLTASAAVTAVPAPVPPSVGEALLHYLNLEGDNDGIVYLFGVPGGGIMHFLDLIKDSREKFRYIVCRQETGAAFMADGYFRATGKLGIVLVTTGPGATNALTGVMNANNDGSAMILISGEVDQQFLGKGYLQEGEDSKININAVYTASTASSMILSSPLSAQTLLQQAFRNIFVLPSQAVHLSLPDNVTSMLLPPGTTLPKTTDRYRAKQHYVNKEDVTEILEVLSTAKRPLIFLGNGCRSALNYHEETYNAHGGGEHDNHHHLAELLHFVEAWGIPVMTTPDGKGVFPERHPLSLRVFGCASCRWPFYWMNLGNKTSQYVSEPYDAIVVIGSSLGDLATSKYFAGLMPSNGAFYQVDIAPEIMGRSYPMKKGIVAEAGAFIQGLRKQMKNFTPDEAVVKARKELLKQIKIDHSPFFAPDEYYATGKPFQSASLMRVLDEHLDEQRETHIFIDAGNCVGWANHYFATILKWNMYSSLSMGPMGFAVGAVVGAKIGRPNATSICITGDGAFMMQGSEVSTAAQYGIGAIWIVLNDNNLSMVSQGMSQFFPDAKDPQIWKELYELGKPDLAKFSEGLGAQAYEVNEPEEMANLMPLVLERANQNHRPQVIIANIDPTKIPPYYAKPPETPPAA